MPGEMGGAARARAKIGDSAVKIIRHKISNADYNLLHRLAKQRGQSMREIFDHVFWAYLLPIKGKPFSAPIERRAAKSTPP